MRKNRNHHLWVEEDYLHFITTVTHKRKPIFRDPAVAKLLIKELHHYAKEYNVLLIAAVVMPDHLHCIIWPQGKQNFSDYMRSIKSYFSHTYTRYLSQAGRRSSLNRRVWQSSFFDYLIQSEAKLEEKMYYIMQNPVEEGLVERPEAYPFLFVHRDYRIE